MRRQYAWMISLTLTALLPFCSAWADCLDRCVAEGCERSKVMTGRVVHTTGEPVRGTVLFLPGRSGILGDREPVLREFFQRGFDVYTLDWRGQGESSRMLEDSHRVHIDTFDQYVDDVCALKMRCRLEHAPRPWILVGHSLGGHIALRMLEEAPECFDGAILVAPMIDVHTSPFPRGFSPYLARFLCLLGWHEQYAPGYGPYDWEAAPFEDNTSTRDPAKFLSSKQYLREHPEYVTGGVTIGWANAMFHSTEKANAKERLAAVEVPILMMNAGDDRVVDASTAASVADSLPRCKERTLHGARHDLFSEEDDTVQELWASIDQWLAVLAPAGVSTSEEPAIANAR